MTLMLIRILFAPVEQWKHCGRGPMPRGVCKITFDLIKLNSINYCLVVAVSAVCLWCCLT